MLQSLTVAGALAVLGQVPSADGDGRILQLVREAWRELPQSVDATYIHTRTQPPTDEQSVREQIRDRNADIIKRMPPEAREQIERELEAAVHRSLARRTGPVRMLRRVRIAEDLQRVDQTVFWANEDLETESNFTETFVNGALLDNGVRDNWSANRKQRVIAHELRSSKRLYKKDDIRLLGTIGETNRLLLQIATRDEAAFARREATLDHSRAEQLASAAHPELLVEVATSDDSVHGTSVDVFQLRLREAPVHPVSTITTASGNAARVLEVRTFNPETGDLLVEITNADFDETGLPRSVTDVRFPPDGHIDENHYEVISFEAGIEIPHDTFEYVVPAGYSEIVYEPDGTKMRRPGEPREGVLPPRAPNNSGRILLIVNCIFALMLIGYFAWRRKHQPQ